VRTHPVTGRKALYAVSGSSFGIVGMPDDEARALLDELAEHATQPRYLLSVSYGVGDVVIWDNASLLHRATLVDPAQARTLLARHRQGAGPGGHATGVLARTFASRGM
jgi:alpha-ketoglutarate-dependent taurine dioxygenase